MITRAELHVSLVESSDHSCTITSQLFIMFQLCATPVGLYILPTSSKMLSVDPPDGSQGHEMRLIG